MVVVVMMMAGWRVEGAGECCGWLWLLVGEDGGRGAAVFKDQPAGE
jgi:hypothetical protein